MVLSASEGALLDKPATAPARLVHQVPLEDGDILRPVQTLAFLGFDVGHGRSPGGVRLMLTQTAGEFQFREVQDIMRCHLWHSWACI